MSGFVYCTVGPRVWMTALRIVLLAEWLELLWLITARLWVGMILAPSTTQSLRLRACVLDKIYEPLFSCDYFCRVSVQLRGKTEHECQVLVLEGIAMWQEQSGLGGGSSVSPADLEGSGFTDESTQLFSKYVNFLSGSHCQENLSGRASHSKESKWQRLEPG